MLLWFVGTACTVAWFVFHDRCFNYRALAVGAVAPDLVDGVVWKGAGALHSMVTVMALMVAAVLATVGRRNLRRQLIAVAIGVMLHLVFDAAFADASVFWWPLSGWSFEGAALPSADRGLAVGLLLEVVGAGLLAWLYRVHRVSVWSRC
jgi:hypothetical protein